MKSGEDNGNRFILGCMMIYLFLVIMDCKAIYNSNIIISTFLYKFTICHSKETISNNNCPLSVKL